MVGFSVVLILPNRKKRLTMPLYNRIRVCPACRDNYGWDPRGRVCEVCGGAQALYTGDEAPAKDEDAQAFFDYYSEMRDNARKIR